LIALLASSCDGNSTPNDYNNLTVEQKIMLVEIGIDMVEPLTKISFPDTSTNVGTAPEGITASRETSSNGDSSTLILRVNYDSYTGSTYGYTITGTFVDCCYYDNIYDSYPSSENTTINLIATKDGISHSVSLTYDETIDKNTGLRKSYVETGSFDGAGYRESK